MSLLLSHQQLSGLCQSHSHITVLLLGSCHSAQSLQDHAQWRWVPQNAVQRAISLQQRILD